MNAPIFKLLTTLFVSTFITLTIGITKANAAIVYFSAPNQVRSIFELDIAGTLYNVKFMPISTGNNTFNDAFDNNFDDTLGDGYFGQAPLTSFEGTTAENVTQAIITTLAGNTLGATNGGTDGFFIIDSFNNATSVNVWIDGQSDPAKDSVPSLTTLNRDDSGSLASSYAWAFVSLTPLPLPAALWFFIAGFAGIFGFNHRQKIFSK